MTAKDERDEPRDGVELEDLTPPQDPKGGQSSLTTPDSPRTTVRAPDKGGWDANHNCVAARSRRQRRR
jgi:hypothetical protein